jgi:hypothetical protein
VFKNLKSVKLNDTLDEERKKNRTLTLEFSENDFFSNEVLTLTIKYTDSDADEPLHVTGSSI